MIKKVSAFAICTILLFSCTGRGERHADLQPITMGVVDSVPSFLAQRVEMYDSLGLQIDLLVYPSAAERDSALARNAIDGTVIDYIDAITLQNKGLSIRVVMDADTAYHLIAGIGSDIRTPSQLRGRNIAVARNTVVDYITDRILQKNGLTPAQVNKAEIRKTSLRMDLLQSGLVDATVLPEPYAASAIERGNRSLLSTTEAGIATTGIVFTDLALRTKHREIEAFAELSRSPSLPPAGELQQTADWLRQKKLITDDYTIANLTDTIKGIKLN